MQATMIVYERLINTGNYTHEKYGISIQVEQGESAQMALNKAKDFVEKQINAPSPRERAIVSRVHDFDADDIF